MYPWIRIAGKSTDTNKNPSVLYNIKATNEVATIGELSNKGSLKSPAPHQSPLTGLKIGNNRKNRKQKKCDGFCYKPTHADLQLMSPPIYKASFALLRSTLRNCPVRFNQGLKSENVTLGKPRSNLRVAGTGNTRGHLSDSSARAPPPPSSPR